MIRVLIAEDSPVQAQFLCGLLESAGDFEVVGVARDGAEAVRNTAALRPDIVLMDCHMPGIGGLEATQRIMQLCPTPIVVNSATLAPDEAGMSFDAIKCGALAAVAKPVGYNAPDFAKTAEELLRTLRLMSEVKVVGRRIVGRGGTSERAGLVPHFRAEIIALGGSTGAPGVIADILSGLNRPVKAPILMVQHLTEGFASRFADWLATKTALDVHLAEDGMPAQSGHVYLAPYGVQMGIRRSGQICLSNCPPEDGFQPSVTYLFRSVAKAYGSRALGILLTGMGRDGAAGLLEMRRAGAFTVAQSEATCVVYGMPKVAVQLGAACDVLAPKPIAELINSLRTGETETADAPLDQPSVF